MAPKSEPIHIRAQPRRDHMTRLYAPASAVDSRIRTRRVARCRRRANGRHRDTSALKSSMASADWVSGSSVSCFTASQACTVVPARSATVAMTELTSRAWSTPAIMPDHELDTAGRVALADVCDRADWRTLALRIARGRYSVPVGEQGSFRRRMAGLVASEINDHPAMQVAFALACTAGAGALFAASTPITITLAVLLVLLSGAPQLASTWWREQVKDLDGDAVVDQRLLMKEALGPLARLVADYLQAEFPNRERAFGQLVQHAAGACVLPHDNAMGVRSVVFALNETATVMEVLARSGRDQEPSPFVKGTQRGDKAFKVLGSRKPVRVDDLKQVSSRTWSGSGVGYRTFITVPIYDSSGAYGMLSIDAPNAKSLGESDTLFVQLVASMLAIAFAEKTRDRQTATLEVR